MAIFIKTQVQHFFFNSFYFISMYDYKFIIQIYTKNTFFQIPVFATMSSLQWIFSKISSLDALFIPVMTIHINREIE